MRFERLDDKNEDLTYLVGCLWATWLTLRLAPRSQGNVLVFP